MELTYHGANCFKINSKNSVLVVDDNLESLGLKRISREDDALLFTQRVFNREGSEKGIIVIDGPGEYELDDVTVLGIQAKAYTDLDEKRSATIFKVMNGEHQILFLGHIQPKLDSKVLEKIGVVDVLVVPVGGGGYTLDAEDASEVIKLLSPKITIPSHYYDDAIKYEVPMHDIKEFYNKLAINEPATLKTLKLKGELEEAIITLERQ